MSSLVRTNLPGTDIPAGSQPAPNSRQVENQNGAKGAALQTFEELGIPDQFKAEVEQALTSGEKILWLGRPSRNPLVQPPKQIPMFVGIGIIGFAFFLAIVGLVVFWPILLFALVLGVIGGVFLIPSFVTPKDRCMSCYAVTDRRAILAETQIGIGRTRVNTTSYLPQQLVGLERRPHETVAGAGDLIFEYTFMLPGQTIDTKTWSFNTNQNAGFGRTDVAKRVPRGFFHLDQVREVERLIRVTLLGELEKALDEADASAGAAAGQTGYREDGVIPADIKAKALAGIDAGEKIVWVGQPAAKLTFLRNLGWIAAGGLAILVALAWLGLTLMWASAASSATQKMQTVVQQVGKNAKGPAVKMPVPIPTSGPSFKDMAPMFIPPIGVLFVAAGLLAVPFVRRRSSGKTCYVLTNRRAVVYKAGLFGPTRESYSPLEVAKMERSESWLQAGSGDLIFHTVQVLQTTRTSMTKWHQSVKTTHYGFVGIAHLKEVEKLVRETLIDPFVGKLQQAAAAL
jgi:hypothetical protein